MIRLATEIDLGLTSEAIFTCVCTATVGPISFGGTRGRRVNIISFSQWRNSSNNRETSSNIQDP